MAKIKPIDRPSKRFLYQTKRFLKPAHQTFQLSNSNNLNPNLIRQINSPIAIIEEKSESSNIQCYSQSTTCFRTLQEKEDKIEEKRKNKQSNFQIKIIRKAPKNYFIEYQKIFLGQPIYYKYYRKSNSKQKNKIQKKASLIQTFQSFTAYTKSLFKTNFIPIDYEAFGQTFKQKLEEKTLNYKKKLGDRFNSYFKDINSFNENFLLASIYRMYSNKLNGLELPNIYKLLLKNGIEPLKIKNSMEIILKIFLENAKYRYYFEEEMKQFNCSPNFLDRDILGNIVFSNIDQNNIYINLDLVVLKNKLVFKTIYWSFVKLLKYFYVFDFVLRNTFSNSGKNLNYHIVYQIQYNENSLKRYRGRNILDDLSDNFTLENNLFLTLSFEKIS